MAAGDRVSASASSMVDMVIERSDARMVELLAPLFGGSRAIASAADPTRLG